MRDLWKPGCHRRLLLSGMCATWKRSWRVPENCQFRCNKNGLVLRAEKIWLSQESLKIPYQKHGSSVLHRGSQQIWIRVWSNWFWLEIRSVSGTLFVQSLTKVVKYLKIYSNSERIDVPLVEVVGQAWHGRPLASLFLPGSNLQQFTFSDSDVAIQNNASLSPTSNLVFKPTKPSGDICEE